MLHKLKILRKDFINKKLGLKTFEIRDNNPDFQQGDTIQYTVLSPSISSFKLKSKIIPNIYVIDYVIVDVNGLEEGFCIFTDRLIDKEHCLNT